MENLFKYVSVPKAFEEGKNNIWKDEKFSDYVLKSHLDSNIQGGSKDENFIDRAVSYISKTFPPKKHIKVLDIGCGPGIYSEKLSEKGYKVTGLDYSSNSIDYAKRNGSGNVDYILGDLRNLSINDSFNITLIIYQTYATLPYEERLELLYEIHKRLEKDGIFMLDVPSRSYFEKFQNMKLWDYIHQNNDFVKESFLLLYLIQKYENEVLLKKSIYNFESGEIIEFNDWMQHFSIENIEKEIEEYFETIYILSEIDGSDYTNDSDTITLICRKK